MDNKGFMQKHEDILLFLEDNISKLVKLKVASRAKYKQYDEYYNNYIIADNINDEDLMEVYGQMVDDCNFMMFQKLNKELKANPELLQNAVVKEYIKLIK